MAGGGGDIEIAPDETDAVTLFLALDTQWRWGPMTPVGIDYGAIAATAALAGIEVTSGIFGDLKAMEHEALKVFIARQSPRRSEQ